MTRSIVTMLAAMAALLILWPGKGLAENQRPVADAGLPRYAAADPVRLDGSASFDPDNSGSLGYTWRQISGPAVVLTGADTAAPTISGFVQTSDIQECEFELVVSDPELASLPDTAKVVVVPYFGLSTLRLENASFDPNKPTIIYFGGGDCVNGYSGQPWSGGPAWMDGANVIGFPNGYTRDSSTGKRTYYKYGDMIIAYLSAVAPNYTRPIQMLGWSTGADPALDVGIHLNRVYRDARYAVNRVTQLDGGCHVMNEGWGAYLDSVQLFVPSSVDGEQCWIDHYYGTSAYAYEPLWRSDILYVRSGLPHNEVLNWYRNSITGNDMNHFNGGVIGGAYWSVIGPGKNLQLVPEAGVYYFQWNGSAQTGAMVLFNPSEYPGKLPEPVTLLDWHDPGLPDDDPNGVVLTCEESENAVGYQLLSGSDPYNVAAYNIVADSNSPPAIAAAMLPSSDTWWTVKVRDAYGSTIYADPVRVGMPVGVIAYWKLDEVEGNIASDSAGDNDGTLVRTPLWRPTGGKLNGALLANGVDDYIATPFVVDPSKGPFSVFAWVKEGAPGQAILSQAGGANWLMAAAPGGALMTELKGAGRTAKPLASAVNITDGAWHRVGFTWDGTNRILYVDDVEVARNTQTSLTGSTDGLYIGAGSALGDGTFWSGLIDDVRIYNRVVTP